MKVAILIMSANAEPSLRNLKSMKDTFIQMTNELQRSNKLEHEYEFYNYYCNNINDNLEYSVVNDNEHYYELSINLKETIYHTYEKTVIALKHVSNKYDWIIRINSSTFINIKLLDKFISIANNEMIYCNAINSIINDMSYLNELYPRGDFMMFSNDVLNKIIPYLDKYVFCDKALEDRLDVTHVDDCLLGCVIIDSFGKSYYKHLQMLKYNFMPSNYINDIKFEKYAIASRIKTLPPTAKCSGYSWKDNEYRMYDSLKIKQLNELVKTLTYKDICLDDVLVQRENQRPTLFVTLNSISIDAFNAYLRDKE